MPLLTSEPTHYPENLFDGGPQSDGRTRQWYALHTRPRQEKAVARQLLKMRVPFYLPIIARRWRSRGRAMTSHLPLFAGYIFGFADRDERQVALTTNRIVRTLEVPDAEQLWNDLKQIERLIATGAPITPEEKLMPGDRVLIRSGPLAGLQGVILRTASGKRFVVQVDFIQRGASVLLDDFEVGGVD